MVAPFKLRYIKALKLPVLWIVAVPLIMLPGISCMHSATTLHHSGSFSNIRSEIRLTDGTVMRGYASMHSMKGEQDLRFRVPGEREERTFHLSKVDRLLAEEHEFVVKWLLAPNNAMREGRQSRVRAMVKRMGMELDMVQVFEYKYAVSNPKSPISNTMTAWYVSFPYEPENLPLCELNSACYKRKWNELLASNKNLEDAPKKSPTSVKSLLEQVKEISVSSKWKGGQVTECPNRIDNPAND